MDRLCAYEIDFIGLEADDEKRHYVADDDFFGAVDSSDIKHGQVDIEVDIHRSAESFTLNVCMNGAITVVCDRCLGDMQLPINAETQLKVKLGSAFSDDGDLITVAEDNGKLNIAWNLYEQIALQIPIRHVHPDGECDPKAIEAMNLCQPTEDDEPATDPRWDALKKLKGQ